MLPPPPRICHVCGTCLTIRVVSGGAVRARNAHRSLELAAQFEKRFHGLLLLSRANPAEGQRRKVPAAGLSVRSAAEARPLRARLQRRKFAENSRDPRAGRASF